MFSIGHLSDLHTTPVRPDDAAQLFNKRFFGWMSWRLRRRYVYRPDVLEALIQDLTDTDPNEVVVTGDLTNVALESEFDAALAWLDRIGSPDRVFIVPGNHDAYVPVSWAKSWDKWSDYLASDFPPPYGASLGRDGAFPTLRVRGPVAMVGLCSARPTRTFWATGTVGAAQVARLEAVLAELSNSDLCRVILIHHPVIDGATKRRRALTDAEALRAVLRRCGADLVLHGHNHRTQFGAIPGPHGPIPVVGVRSSSYDGRKASKRAHYHIYDFERAEQPRPGARFHVKVRVRAYDSTTRRFTPRGERLL